MINVNKLNKMKRDGDPVAWITAYDFPLSSMAEKAGIDMILVGDSGGMVQLGYASTNPVTMDEMIVLAKSVRRGAPNTFIIGDMPQGSYEISNESAVENALRFVKEAGCNAIKLEGGKRVCDRVRAIANAGILVMGHLGLTPQSADSFGGYRVQGKTQEGLKQILADAKCLEDAGAFAILLEAMPTFPASLVAKSCEIPIYGIGAGTDVDGQLVIMHDILGFYREFRPWFAKCYIPEVVEEYTKYILEHKTNGNIRELGINERADGLLDLAARAISKYIEEVRLGIFPGEEYSYQMTEDQIKKLVEKLND